jgi:exodeoxyribonuclease VII large subunit
MRAVEGIPEHPTVSVGRLANYIKQRLGDDPKLRFLGVRGEVSNRREQANGNIYFDLKDRDALVKCIVWSEAAMQMAPFANGDDLIAVGGVTTYPRSSTYQLNVRFIEQPGGVGRLHALYEQLKRRLDAEGLFADARKRPLPKYPFRVALVSSPSANGAGDFLAQARVLAPHVAIQLFKTSVQGASAAPEIVRALAAASRAPVDLIVLARGGGSYEDLFVFNDERVVRALAACAHPTISAIGHEVDMPLTDLAADMRASTPTAAAQLFLPKRADLLRSLATTTVALDRAALRNLDRARKALDRLQIRSPLTDGRRLLAARRQAVDLAATGLLRGISAVRQARRTRFDGLQKRLEARNPSVQLAVRERRLAVAVTQLYRAAGEPAARARRRFDAVAARLLPAAGMVVGRRRDRLRLLRAHLDGRDPTQILARGYAIVTVDGRAITDAATVAAGTRIDAQLARGTLRARVESSGPNG